MTTPDKEEMPTEDRTAVLLATAISYLREEADFNRSWADGRRKVDFGPGSDSEGYKAHRLELAAVREAWADAIECVRNAYEPMREALILAEKADRIHSKCQECEDGAQAPEACGDCFPSADDARVARRNVLKSLGVRMRDVDRARAIKAEPSICNCSQEDVHDYGPCGEDCRSLVVSTLPVNDRHHSGGESYQAGASAPALSEKFNLAGEWLPIASAPKDGTKIDLLYPYPRGRTINCYWGETDLHCGPLWVKRNPTWGANGLLPEREWSTSCFPNMEPTHWMPAPALPDGWLNFSNDAGSDAGSLKPDTSSQPASEAGKLSSEAES